MQILFFVSVCILKLHLSIKCDIIAMYLGVFMQITNISKSLSATEFNKDEFFEQQKDICELFKTILKTYKEKENTFDLHDAKEFISNLNSEIYLQNLSAKFFVLSEEKSPVSFAIFTSKDNVLWTLEQIWTKKDYVRFGFATMLLRVCAINILGSNGATIKMQTKTNQEIAEKLFDSFSKVEGIEQIKKQNNIGGNDYLFEIKNASVSAMQEAIQKLAI